MARPRARRAAAERAITRRQLIEAGIGATAACMFAACAREDNREDPPEPRGVNAGASGSAGGGGSDDVMPIKAAVTPLRGTGALLVSSGFPFKPGQLTPEDVNNRLLRVWVAGVEQSIYAEPLEGLHPDGTVRCVLIQFGYTFPDGSAVDAQVQLGTLRATDDVAKTALDSTNGFPYPHPTIDEAPTSPVHHWGDYGYAPAVILPTEPAHLIACNLVLPCNTVASDLARGGVPARFAADFVTCSNDKWAWFTSEAHQDASSVGDMLYSNNYYDRGASHLVYWIRTGDVEYYRRGCAYSYNWRIGYAQPSTGYQYPSGYAADPYNTGQLEGLMLHYWVTGDADSRAGVGYAVGWWLGSVAWDQKLACAENPYQDPRQQEKVLQGLLFAQLLGFTTIQSGQDGIGYSVTTKLRNTLDKILGMTVYDGDPTYQTSGLYAGVWKQPDAAACPSTITCFMIGMCGHAMVQYAELFEPDPRIVPALQKMIDWLYANALLEGQGYGGEGDAFQYLENDSCPGEGSTAAAPDLGGLYLGMLAYHYRQTQDDAYRARLDSQYLGARSGGFEDPDVEGDGQKQFNQAIAQSQFVTYYRYGST